MSRNLILEFGPDLVKQIESLGQDYGEDSPLTTISRALGLMAALKPYIKDGVLTVIDSNAPATEMDEEREVDLVFETLRREAA